MSCYCAGAFMDKDDDGARKEIITSCAAQRNQRGITVTFGVKEPLCNAVAAAGKPCLLDCCLVLLHIIQIKLLCTTIVVDSTRKKFSFGGVLFDHCHNISSVHKLLRNQWSRSLLKRAAMQYYFRSSLRTFQSCTQVIMVTRVR